MNQTNLAKPTVFVDADNTLWDTDGVYAKAQLQLLSAVEKVVGRSAEEDRLQFVRSIDQALAEKHHLGLRYPVRFLVAAIARALVNCPPDKSRNAPRTSSDGSKLLESDVVTAIERDFIDSLSKTPSALPGVQEGLQRLHACGATILVLSEGSRARVLRTATELGIAPIIGRIIESPKHERLYLRVLKLVGYPDRTFMIGDQLQRDILPAKTAGLTTIYVPSRFRPRWEPSEAIVRPSYRVDRFDQAADIIVSSCS